MFDLIEYGERLNKLQKIVREKSLDYIAIFDSVNLYYYTGTAQNGVLIVPPNNQPYYFVRRNIDRAKLESQMEYIFSMNSFRDVFSYLETIGVKSDNIGIAMGQITLAMFNLFKKYLLNQTEFFDVTTELVYVRAIKSLAEIALLKEAGRRQEIVFNSIPQMIEAGMTEWQLGTAIISRMLVEGDSGIARLSVSTSVLGCGNVSSGDFANYPTCFDGPGGNKGLSSALPVVGSDKKISKNEPIYIDFVFSHEGYFVDRTRIFSIGTLDDRLVKAHENCLRIQGEIISRMQPGAIPSGIYKDLSSIINTMGIDHGFMGVGRNNVKFLGHGIGLVVDEYPVIAPKFDIPIEEGMVIAVEPKLGIAGLGMVGIENTWLITSLGAEKITKGEDNVVYI